MTQRTFVLPYDGAGAADPAVTGHKGAAVARLAAAGLPVPAGFLVTAEAYRAFIDDNGLLEPILGLAARVDPDLPATAERAARQIAELMERCDLPMEVAGPVRWGYAGLGAQDDPVAVRSSATALDGWPPPVGWHETVLNVRGEAALLDAIRRCWASLWSAPAIEHRVRNGIDHGEATQAVLVQCLVSAEASGTMVTTTASPGRILLNAAWGMGEPVITGRVTPDALVLEKGTGTVLERRTADKATMTVPRRAPGEAGTQEEPVPDRWRTLPVLGDDQAAALARLGERIEALYGRPLMIEWALHDGNPFVLQARPLEDDRGWEDTEEWNDSLSGDYLWTSANMGEAVPDVMTPCTWSLVQMYMHETMPASTVPGFPEIRAYGNIGGRLYMNLSVANAFARVLGTGKRAGRAGLEQVFGKVPPEVRIPPLPVSKAEVARWLLPVAAKARLKARADGRRLPDFLASSPGRCEALRDRIQVETDPGALLHLWGQALLPFFREACHMLGAARRRRAPSLIMLRRELARLAGEADADAMLAGLGRPGGPVPAGLGPVIGLAELARGEIDRATYLREWGHRGAHEFEISAPRPAEEPEGVHVPANSASGHDAVELLGRQRDASRAAWKRFSARHPGRVAGVRRRVGRWARAAYQRDAARSEVMRVYAVIRAFVLRAGELTGRRDDLFYLTIDEILAVLDGDARPLERVAVRRRTYDRYRALAPYPVLIRGPFEPVAWAGARVRRTDLFDATDPLAGYGTRGPENASISGFPGVAAVVEGTVRVLDAPEHGGELRPGEVLVTSAANIGWTPLFPVAAAVVTDVGAPLSPAATVARELAVPAVVGCGNATMRLRTGDRVRVDAGRGTVRLLTVSGRDGDVGSGPGDLREPQPTREG
ncbi:PEP/pyruvate-binding domain-containing protein [Actinomadura sp. SCN-SB]|uniref:PEP/pyruvate-binding domain-containing protein n=1 Tax=Actinomadura sp. SCN-SB TaxID=3373092 RepID=UPI0037536015